jgi:hypothetical protein
MGKNSKSGIRDEHPDHISASLETMFLFKNTSILLCRSRSGIWNLIDPGSGINIPDLQHWKEY